MLPRLVFHFSRGNVEETRGETLWQKSPFDGTEKRAGTLCLLLRIVSCVMFTVVAFAATHRRSEGENRPRGEHTNNIPSARPGWPGGSL